MLTYDARSRRKINCKYSHWYLSWTLKISLWIRCFKPKPPVGVGTIKNPLLIVILRVLISDYTFKECALIYKICLICPFIQTWCKFYLLLIAIEWLDSTECCGHILCTSCLATNAMMPQYLHKMHLLPVRRIKV